MHGAWITGAEIMQEHGARAFEIGQACYDGTLQAFTEAGTPILEETKIAKIPKFPPPTADPLEHIQYSCCPSWDWIAQIRNPYKNERVLTKE